MAETKFPKYRIKPGQTVNQNGVIHGEGTELEMAPHVAIELRSILEPVDPADAFPEIKSGVRQGSAEMRDHEKQQVLEARKKSLEGQLAMVNEQIEALQPKTQQPAPKAAPQTKPEAKE